jgi:hypothetical protein
MHQDDPCLEALLDLNGMTYYYDSGYWIKYEARRVPPRPELPHGIRYSLTLHDPGGQRIFGIDNAHLPNQRRKTGTVRKVTWDHQHHREKIVPFDFLSIEELLDEFERNIDKILKRITWSNGDTP